MEGLGFQLRAEAVLHTLTEDVLKSSEIEGEKLDRDQVRSSIARRLGIDIGGLMPADRDVEGVVEMMLDATQRYDQPSDRSAAVRLARGVVPYWPQRDVEDQRRGLARRQNRPDAGGVGADRQGARPLRSACGRPRSPRDEEIPRLVREGQFDRSCAQVRRRASVVRHHPPVR